MRLNFLLLPHSSQIGEDIWIGRALPLVHCSWSQLNIWTKYCWLAHCVWLFCCPSVCCLDSTSNWFSILAIQLASKTNSYPYFFILTSFTPLSVGISSNHPYRALEQGGNSNLHLGSFKNYVDKFLAFFDHLLAWVDIFYLINVDKNKTFLNYLPASSCKRSL